MAVAPSPSLPLLLLLLLPLSLSLSVALSCDSMPSGMARNCPTACGRCGCICCGTACARQSASHAARGTAGDEWSGKLSQRPR
ncbi:hypothetical protein TSOC_013629 [Tetrabaena socialis]|uniref:Secreted protein n=1 Tax=Tetrabaena socialis TaxID=47790 RepID=A0A2J7ZJV8_9CHLO|nr:hypothetical protein TSOC_013629 [Tetrabaena socialis]|eukprot:PNH00542.1 hypothetical protein TSOC_013629 [Tetrabaena socialis]